MESWFDSQHRIQFLLSEPSGHVLGLTPSSIKWAPAALSQRINQPGCEGVQLPLSSAEIKNVWRLPPCVFMLRRRKTLLSATRLHVPHDS
jgi:hypothetical protein